MEGYMGEIRLFAGNFEPRNWAFCNGQILQIADYQALFSILGTTYGGDGQETFALPDLRGRVPVGPQTVGGSAKIEQGDQGGKEEVALTSANLPAHTHPVANTLSVAIKCSAVVGGGSDDPTNGFIGGSGGSNMYTTNTNGYMNPKAAELSGTITVGQTGQSQPVPIRNPYLGMNYMICTNGIFPTRK